MNNQINFHSIVKTAINQKNVTAFLRRTMERAKIDYFYSESEFYGDLRDEVQRLDTHSRKQFQKQQDALKQQLDDAIKGRFWFDFRTYKLNNPDYTGDEFTYKKEQTQKLIKQLRSALNNEYLDKFISIFDALKTLDPPTSFTGIAKDLREWIKDADDATLTGIIKNKSVPDGKARPQWIERHGKWADAHRFRLWAKMSIPEMKKCFSNLDKLHDAQRKGNFIPDKSGSIYDSLKNYQKI